MCHTFSVIHYQNQTKFKPHSFRGLHFVLCSFQLRLTATMLKSYSFNPLWRMNTTVFSRNINLIPHLRAIIGRLLQKIILVRSLRSNFIDSFSFTMLYKETLQLRGNTSQGFGAFFFQSCDRLLFLFFLFLVFFFSFFLDFYCNQWLSFESTVHWFVLLIIYCFNGSEIELRHLAKNSYFGISLAML